MCTLSFIPNKDNWKDFTVTSNRDESPNRETIPPKNYSEMGVEMLYPKDEVAGGTWIGSSSKKRLVCLMNGGFRPHKRKNNYRMSRGVLVKKLLSAENKTKFLDDFNLNDVEPFTMIGIDWSVGMELFKLVWDGKKKHLKNLPVQAYIWSASMLYSEETKHEREQLFEKFMKARGGKPTDDQLLEFHKRFIINRKFVKTTSITQFALKNGLSDMHYFPLN